MAEQRTGGNTGRRVLDGADAVLTNHRMVRDGSFWRCLNGCGAEHPFPSPMPVLGETCVPRRWGDPDGDQ